MVKRQCLCCTEIAESDVVQIGAWIDYLGNNDEQFQELVISLELTRFTKEIALNLIKKWANSDTSEKDMESYINQTLASF